MMTKTVQLTSNTSPQRPTPAGARLYLQIAEKLAGRISAGELPPGSRLPAERDLAQSYDVSRQTVREALIALEVSGMVEIRPGSGIYVQKAAEKRHGLKSSIVADDAPGPLEIMEARLLLEGDAAALAAERISNEELQKLKAYLQQMTLLVQAQKSSEAEAFDGKFHQLIASATRNSALQSMIEWLWQLRESSELSRLFARKIQQQVAGPNILAHEKIYQCISRRDADGARSAMQAHISEVTQAYLLLISD
ncbi:GntR family transcriptional repressor for pyruvate dehydrogenase complex [Rheinheimera pacifica]|uniref:FadR/GntR family transcriptional regulator n=1 Tax=Rheinheimera pacifica TaxID=173990 RepID=UPI000CB37B4A|nr:FadR/GntR family transcriptional regulator [Rheinheimera pacifica]MDR6984635.1 GntR family transcriptional repressor for pyruvate dehydrogenase complex [Rheinheimera pacifica]PKM20728.1 MAG: GntR family transcriptional regulator [Gammaproteobacteria bacterium HGW-Gammaproteobacteria-15]